jgi:hypothetical protein
MKSRNISPKLERDTECYLISVGSSRESLTDEQFRVVAKYVKERKSQPYLMAALLVFVAINVLLIIAFIIRVKSLVESGIPKDIKEIVLISPAGENHISPIVLGTDFMIIAVAGWICGFITVLLIRYIVDIIFVGFGFRGRKQREILECFLPKVHGMGSV